MPSNEAGKPGKEMEMSDRVGSVVKGSVIRFREPSVGFTRGFQMRTRILGLCVGLLLVGWSLTTRAATVTWKAAVSGNWSDGTKWSTGTPPGAADTAVIDIGGTYTVTVNVAATVAGLTLNAPSGQVTLDLSSASFVLNGPGAANANSQVRLLPSGILDGTGDLAIQGRFEWPAGQIQGAGKLTFLPGSLVNVTPGGQHTLRDRRVINGSTVNWTSVGPDYVGFGAVWENQAGATLDLKGAIQTIFWGGVPASFQNAGTLIKSAGTGAASFDFQVVNVGSVTVNTGILNLRQGGTIGGNWNVAAGATVGFAGGVFANAPTTTFAGTGRYLISGGTYNVAVPQTTGVYVELGTSGVLQGPADLVLTGQFDWTAGQIEGAGRLTFDPTALVSVLPGGPHTLRDRRVVNGAAVDWTSPGPDYVGFGAIWNNQAGSVLDLKNAAQIYYWGGVPASFENLGTVVKSGGVGVAYFDFTVQNQSTFAVNSGTLNLRQGGTLAAGWSVGAGATLVFNGGVFNNHASSGFSGPGRFVIAGGTYNVVANQTTGIFLELASAGTLQGAADLTLTGRFDWTGGQIEGTGKLAWPAGALVGVRPGGPHTLRDRRIVNGTTVAWTSPGPDYFGFGSIWENQPGSLLDLQNAAQVYFWAGVPTVFQNAGSFLKSGGVGAAYFDCLVQNSGTFAVKAGNLNLRQGAVLSAAWQVDSGASLIFNGGTFTTAATTALAGSGRYLISGGTYNVAASQVTDVYLELGVSGTLQGAGDLTLNGQFDWTGGQIEGTGKLTFGSGSVVSVLPGGPHTLRDRRIVNQTSVDWSSPGPDYVGFGAIWENQAGAVLDLKNAAQIYFWSGVPAAFQNAGTLVKSGGVGIAYFDFQVQNTGTFYVNTGNLTLRQGAVLSSVWNVAAGAQLVFNAGTFTTHATTAFGGGGRYIISGGTYNVAVPQSTGVQLELGSTGILQGAAELTLSGKFDWTGGQIEGAGLLTLTPSAVVSVLPGGQHTLRDRRIVNNTSVAWTSPGPDYVGYGAVWDNQAGATVDLQNAAQIYYWAGAPATFNNSGKLLKSAGVGVGYFDFNVQNTNTVTLQSGTLSFRQGLTQSAGRLQLFGGNLEGSPVLLNIRGGTLEGYGTIGTGVSMAGDLRPGNPLGKLQIIPNWNMTNTPTSHSYFQIGGTSAGVDYDQFFTAGGLNLGGELRVEFLNGFEPNGADVFEIMRGAVRLGTFSTTNAPAGYAADVTYSSTNVTLRFSKSSVLPPQITLQPVAVAVTNGTPASFVVGATGSGLTYQWRRNGVNLPGATAATLNFAATRFVDAGSYDVVVATLGGSEQSVSVALTVIPASLEAGLLARYALDGSLLDTIGGYNATAVGTTRYVTNSARDRAFRFDGATYLSLGATPSEPIVNSAEAFSTAFWIRPRTIKEMVPVRLATPDGEFAVYLSSGNNGDYATHFGFRGHLGPATVDPRAVVGSQVGCWMHVVLVYRGGDKNLSANYAAYFNGTAIPLPGIVNLGGGAGLNELGRNISGVNGYVNGDLDEVRIYGRALRAEDALALAANPPDCPPEITQTPANQTVNPGGTAFFSVAAIGATPMTYQWRRNAAPLEGATAATLTIVNAQATNIAEYSVVVGNRFGAVTSAPATLTINTLPPVITANPVGDAVAPGGTATFTVTVIGDSLSFQWYKNNVAINGATSASFTLASVKAADDATYSVVVTNPAGAVGSAGAALDVLPPPNAEGLVARYPFDNALTDVINGRSLQTAGTTLFGTNGPRNGWIVLRNSRYANLPANSDPLLRVDQPFAVTYWMRHINLANAQPVVIGGFRGNATVSFSGDQPGNSLGAGVTALVTLGTNSTRFVTTDLRASLVTNLGCWTHVALNFRGGNEADPANTELWINGARVSLVSSGAGGPVGNGNTLIYAGPGALNGSDPTAADGVDELRVYQRALAEAEVTTLAADVPERAPEFIQQPAGVSVALGGNFSLNAYVVGRPGISYQWFKDKVAIAGATAPSYARLAGLDAAGTYWLVASNRFGATVGSNAVVNVVVAPPPGLAVLNTGTSNFITGASFLNRNFGYISLLGGGVCVTANGGLTWTPLVTGISTDLYAVQAIGGVSYVAGANGVICISTNLGSSWTAFNTGVSATFYGLTFETPSSGWAVGSGGTICRYNGRTWVATPTGIGATCYGVAYGGSVPWAVGAAGTICRYVGGAWQSVNTGTSATFYCVAFSGANVGLAVGSGGTICRYNGTAWIPVNSGTSATIRNVVWADANTAYIVGDGGLLCISTDGGLTWSPLNTGSGLNWGGFAISGGSGYVFGAGGTGLSFGVPVQPVNLPPLIRIIEPVTNQQFFACYDIPITALASDPDGRVVKVEFYRGQFKLGETTRIQPAGRPFFSRFHTDVFGKYELRAVATDNLGAVTISDPVTIEVIPPPLFTAVADGYTESDGMSICYLGRVGTNYILQATPDLELPLKWESISTNEMPELLLRVLDPQATNRPLRYYRFVQQP